MEKPAKIRIALLDLSVNTVRPSDPATQKKKKENVTDSKRFIGMLARDVGLLIVSYW